jgi:hypothetical protein
VTTGHGPAGRNQIRVSITIDDALAIERNKRKDRTACKNLSPAGAFCKKFVKHSTPSPPSPKSQQWRKWRNSWRGKDNLQTFGAPLR